MKELSVDLIVFDFDGTLVDSKRDIAFAVNETLKRMDIPSLSEETIYSYVGNGVRPLIEEMVASAGKENALETALGHFRSVYIEHLLDTTVMFKGVKEVLEHFAPHKKMAVASNKPYRYVKKILDGLKMSGYFVSVKGGDSVETKKPAPEMLHAIISEASVKSSDTVFVGDSGVDIRTGKNAGVKTIGVTYGFRSKEEILENDPDAIINSPDELKKLISC